MPDVVLPVLNEAAAIPDVLASIPAGWTAIVVDNGSTDGSADVARTGGALVVGEPRRGFGAACFAGLQAATSDVVAFMDCDGSLDGSDLPRVAAPGRRRARAISCSASATRPRGAWPLHLRLANRVLARAVERRTGGRADRSRPDAGRVAGGAARARADATAASAGRSRWSLPRGTGRLAHRGGRRCLRARVGRSKVTGTVRGTVRTVHDMRVALR